MAGQREGMTTRRRSDMWDRIKILLLLVLVAVVLVGSRVQPPFIPLDVALREFLSEPIGFIIAGLFILEIFRQIHYLLCERSVRYNTYWESRVLGGWEKLAGRLKPWTRYRMRRYFRWAIYLAIYAYAVMWLVPGIETPVQAIGELPRLIVGVFTNPMFWQIIMSFTIIVGQFVFLFWFLSREGPTSSPPKRSRPGSRTSGVRTTSSIRSRRTSPSWSARTRSRPRAGTSPVGSCSGDLRGPGRHSSPRGSPARPAAPMCSSTRAHSSRCSWVSGSSR